MDPWTHDHTWRETDRTETPEGVTVQKRCDACGMLMSIGPGRVETEEERFRRRVKEAVIEDIRANGPIRMALLGIFRDEQDSHA
jgi:hypothetical protein